MEHVCARYTGLVYLRALYLDIEMLSRRTSRT